MVGQKPVSSKCCFKAAIRTFLKIHLQPILAPISECRVNELFLGSAVSTVLAQNWLFKIILQAWWQVRELFSRNNEIILQMFMKQEAQKCPTGKVVMRVGVWSQLGREELVECQGKWAWVGHKQLSGRQEACIWQCKEGKKRKKWDAKTCGGDLCSNILDRDKQSKMCCQGKTEGVRVIQSS